jgi:hypothetical protein
MVPRTVRNLFYKAKVNNLQVINVWTLRNLIHSFYFLSLARNTLEDRFLSKQAI